MPEHPYEELNERRDQAKHHAGEARRWATAADAAAVAAEDPDQREAHREGERAKRCAAVAQAHGLAAIATAAGGGGILSIEDLGR